MDGAAPTGEKRKSDWLSIKKEKGRLLTAMWVSNEHRRVRFDTDKPKSSGRYEFDIRGFETLRSVCHRIVQVPATVSGGCRLR